MYLFQRSSNQHLFRYTSIYIPLCIYFNNFWGRYKLITIVIYIPLCIYFNQYLANKKWKAAIDLHSTMYLFQPRIFRSLISIRIVVALLSTKQTSIIFILTCSDNIWISTDKIRIVDPPVILQYYVPTVKAKNSSDLPFYPRILCPTIVAACF